MADGSYYTWVDAQGRIHNVPMNPNENSEKEPPAESPPGDDNVYLSEQEVEERIRQYDEDNPAFYVTVEADGRVRTEVYDAEAEQNAAAEEVSDDGAVVIGWDPMLAPPFRVDPEVTAGACCESFSDQFVDVLVPFKSVQLFDPVRYRAFPTGRGNRSAWYFNVGPAAETTTGQRFLMLRLRGAPVKGRLIALNAAGKPLYHEVEMPFDTTPESWHSMAYHEYKILIEDSAVERFIFYLDLKPAEELSLEVRWADGYVPFQ
ncbi:MAG: hypothetical protein VXZ24_06880 [Pseudomonadota bacterium]|nr:hypothetical protein [Pseudomonadota bacterium]